MDSTRILNPKNGQRSRKSWKTNWKVSPIALFLLVLFVQVGDAQRVIASLGSKLKRLNNKNGSKKSDGDYIVKGKGKEMPVVLSFFELFAQESSVELHIAGSVLLATLYLLSFWNKRKAQKGEGEFDMKMKLMSIQLIQTNFVHFFSSDKTKLTKSVVVTVPPDEIVVKNDHVMPLGNLDTVDLGFSDIRLELNTKKGTKVLLDGSVTGRARPGRMLAIMGPSGAGKSSVLHAIAGKIKHNSHIHLAGKRYVNGRPITGDSKVPCAFVEQAVDFFPHMTVQETLNFRVELKLGNRISKAARNELVQSLIIQLGLEKAASTVVGDSKIRGISGGERRRLAIACELVSSPSTIFLDEPTSGLDSTAASNLVETLRKLADTGKTIVAVIHQPSQHVFAAFDDLMLVSEGKLMYFGEVAAVRKYMDTHASEAPAEMGTAEHILDCISKAELLGETTEEAYNRMEKLASLARSQTTDIGSTSRKVKRFSGDLGSGPRANIITQFKLLLKRSLRENFRGKAKLLIQTVQQVSLGLIYGGIYSIGSNQASIQDRFGILSLIAIGASNMAVASTIRAFPKEKVIVSSELASNMYGTLPYFIGKAISEIPQTAFFNSLFGVLVSVFTGLNNTVAKLRRFLGLNSLHGLTSQSAGLLIGAISPNSDTALALFPAIMVLNIIFDGKNISEENTPRLLRWLPKVGLIRWGFEGLCLNEFEGLEFDTKGRQRGPVARNGEEALARFGLADKKLGNVVKAQIMITSACWFLSYVGLTLTKQKFQFMEDPKEEESSRRT